MGVDLALARCWCKWYQETKEHLCLGISSHFLQGRAAKSFESLSLDPQTSRCEDEIAAKLNNK